MAPDEDGAVFAPRSVRGSGGRPLIAAGILAAVGGLVLTGALGSRPDGATLAVASAVPAPTVTAADGPRSKRFADEPPSPWAMARPLVRLDVRPEGRGLRVRGELLTDRVIVVVVSLRNALGETVAIRSIDTPGDGTPAGSGTTTAFEVRFARPLLESDWGHATVQVNCYDRVGKTVASLSVAAEARPG